MNSVSQELATAYHEAGHAVVSCHYKRIPATVSIVPDGMGAVGSVYFNDDVPVEYRNYLGDGDDKKSYIEMRVVTKLAGSCAHDVIDKLRVKDIGDICDDKCAMNIIIENASWAEDDREGYLETCRKIAKEIIDKNWEWIEAVVVELMLMKTLEGSHILRLRV